MIPKTEWRTLLLNRRKAISQNRREEAAHLLVQNLRHKGKILSFTSIGSEIDTGPLNACLQANNTLFLVPYKIDALPQISLESIDCILVPALGFDRTLHRLGYGQGYYDRLLARVSHALTIGIGFKEQFCEALPHDPWDVPVQELLLV